MAMNRISIPKVDDIHSDDAPAPSWSLWRGRVLLRCNCDHVTTLAEGHTIDDQGNVNPSIFHDVDYCGWHLWGKLENWNPNINDS